MESPHPLAEWIDARMSRTDFANKIGTSKSHLALVLQRKRGLSLDLAVKIEGVTEGEFPAARLLQEQAREAAE